MKFSCVFPGQGSQSVGMLRELAASYPEVQETFAQASDRLGYDLWDLVQTGPAEELGVTKRTQPAMLSAGVATWRCWLAASDGAMPELLAGHSLGEYTALVCGGALGFEDAVSLVEYRGELMQQAVGEGEGAMAAVLGLDDDKVREVCATAAGNEVVEAVNYNAPGQVVIAGNREAVQRACDLASEAGARRCIALPVSVPSHCALMKGAAESLSELLREVTIKTPSVGVINNVDVETRSAPDDIRDALVRQLYSPVRWVESVLALQHAGVSLVLECGPGKVLAGLNRRIDRKMGALSLVDPASLEEAAGMTKGGHDA